MNTEQGISKSELVSTSSILILSLFEIHHSIFDIQYSIPDIPYFSIKPHELE